MSSKGQPAKILVAGAGYGGLETALALQDAVADSIEITLLTPPAELAYRPVSSGAPFVRQPARAISINRLAAERGLRLSAEEIVTVEDSEHRVLTHNGDLIDFDALVIAVGADHKQPAVPALAWGNSPDRRQLATLLGELVSGAVSSVAVTVPCGTGWPLAGYEAALILAWTASRLAPAPVSVTVLTAEQRPGSELGADAADRIGQLLSDANVEVLSSRTANELSAQACVPPAGDATQGARIVIGDPGHQITVNRLLSVPELVGPGLPGLASAPGGFLPTGADGRVVGAARVWAVGDVARRPIRHSTITAAEADTAASSIVATLGLGEPPPAPSLALHGILVDAPEQRWWDANEAHLHDGQLATECLWWPPEQALGHHLSRWLRTQDHAVHGELRWHPRGLAVIVATSAEDRELDGLTPAIRPPERALLRDAENREQMTIHRVEHEMAATAHQLDQQLRELDDRQRVVAEHLRAAGYVQNHDRAR